MKDNQDDRVLHIFEMEQSERKKNIKYDFKIRLGTINRYCGNRGGKDHHIDDWFLHPLLDLILIKTEIEFKFNENISSIALPTKTEAYNPPDLLMVAGWGRMDLPSHIIKLCKNMFKKNRDSLKYTEMPLYDGHDARKNHPKAAFILLGYDDTKRGPLLVNCCFKN